MTFRFPVIVAFCALALAVTACEKEERVSTPTLNSPRDLLVANLCNEKVDGQTQLRKSAGDCGGQELEFLVITNTGERFVHVVQSAPNSPAFLDFNTEIPGITGILVPDGPVGLAATRHPTIVAVSSEREPALSFVDFALAQTVDITLDGAAIGKRIQFRETPGVLRSIVDEDGTTWLALGFPASQRLELFQVNATCQGPDTASPGCTPEVELTSVASLPLPAAPTDLVLLADGRAWVSVQNTPAVWALQLFGEPADDSVTCAAPPCLLAPLAVGPECADGIDNDGDGLTDAEDPQCFAPGDSESASDPDDDAASGCSDGIDNDGDGLIDAEDPDCYGPGAQEQALADAPDVLEIPFGEGVRQLPSQADWEGPAALPACSDGIDNDGDGLVDWPEDPDCYGPNDDSEGDNPHARVSHLALTEEGDLLMVLDRRTRQVFFYETATGERIRIEEFQPVSSEGGVGVNGYFPGPMLAETTAGTLELTSNAVAQRADGSGVDVYTHAHLIERRLHVATLRGVADTIIIDRTWEVFTGLPGTAGVKSYGPVRDEVFEAIDLNLLDPVVQNLNCVIPLTLNPDTPGYNSCRDEPLPRPLPNQAPTNRCGEPLTAPEGTTYWSNDTEWYVGLNPQIGRTEFVRAADCETPLDTPLVELGLPHATQLRSGRWEVVFEGVINGTKRQDGVIVERDDQGRAWLEVSNQDPCANETPTFCSEQVVDADLCPSLASLCRNAASSQAVCELGLDLCSLCPALCHASDFCASGTLPGDIVELTPFTAEGLSAQCEPFSKPASGSSSTTAQIPLEYEVCAITPNRLLIAPFESGCDGQGNARPRVISELPPDDCLLEPMEVQVRAQDWLVRAGTQVGPSPYQTQGGQCAFHPDAAERLMRVSLGSPFQMPNAPTFTLESRATDASVPGYSIYPRDFSIQFEVEPNLRARTTSSKQFLLGPATSAMAISRNGSNRRIAVLDESLNTLWLYYADNYRSATDALY